MATQPVITRSSIQEPQGSRVRIQIVFQVILLGLLVLLLLNYKGTAGFNKIAQTRATGHLNVPALQMGNNSAASSSIRATVNYLKIVWPALVFGVLISAAVRTSLSRTPLRTFFGRGAVRDQITAALAGMPLMLCSCCVAPLFPSVYERTRRVAPALTMALASPSLNPVALILSFILFPWRIAGARLAMALTLVLIGSAFVASVTRSFALVKKASEEEPPSASWSALFAAYAKSLAFVSLRTVPLVVLGIWGSMWIMSRVSFNMGVHIGTQILAIGVIALIALLLTLPSLFEIPLALSVLAIGGPVGGAAAILFAGPAINLPSLLVIGRHSNWKVSACLAFTVWAIAVTGGMLLR